MGRIREMLKRLLDAKLARIGLMVWLALLTYLSVVKRPGLRSFDQTDKLEHFGAYMVLGLLIVRAEIKGVGVLWGIVCASLFGALMEVLQYFTPPREASILDEICNLIGASLGCYLARRIKD
jgi:VanZ family protein